MWFLLSQNNINLGWYMSFDDNIGLQDCWENQRGGAPTLAKWWQWSLHSTELVAIVTLTMTLVSRFCHWLASVGCSVKEVSASFQEAHSPAAKENFHDWSYLGRHACEQRLECSKIRRFMGRKFFSLFFFQKKKSLMLFLCCFSHQKEKREEESEFNLFFKRTCKWLTEHKGPAS